MSHLNVWVHVDIVEKIGKAELNSRETTAFVIILINVIFI